MRTEIPTLNPDDLMREYSQYSQLLSVLPQFSASTHNIFHINRIEDFIRDIKFPLPIHLQPRRVTVFSFFFLTNGTSTRTKGLNTYHFGKNTFFFTPRHQIFMHPAIGADAEGYYCHFSLELLATDYKLRDLFLDFPFLEANGHPLVQIDNRTQNFVLPLLERLMTEYLTTRATNNDILRTYLIALFTELKPFIQTALPIKLNAAAIITDQYKKALEQHIYQKQKVTDYATLLSITPNHLNKCVKSALGKSAHDLLDEMLTLEAKVLLKQTTLGISEIAFRIGKNEVSDFARFFKAQTGMKPSEYRESGQPALD
jgi:AraC-like DNA-binding protein